MSDWPVRLASGERIADRVAIVVAHPDDELFCGALFARLDDAVLIHVTDGAPTDMHDGHRLGFATREAYAEARAAELDQALNALGYAGERRGYGVRDKEAVFALEEVVARLRKDLAGSAVVITHPYEGGHPDHDACALAIARAATAPVIEFACYAQDRGERTFGRFVPDPACREHRRMLAAPDRARVDQGFRSHGTQAHVLGDWRPKAEHWRISPSYDFSRPPPGDGALYDGFGWDLTAERWRAVATKALQPA